MRRIRGLTLIELLAVVTLMGIAISLIIIRLDRLTDAGRLRASARQIESLISVARTEALTHGRPLILRYRPNHDAVAILRPTLRDGEILWRRTPGIQLTGWVRVEDVTKPASLIQTNSIEHVDVRVDANGGIDSHRVTLSIRDEFRRIVAIDGVTGMATIMEPSTEAE